MTNATPMIIPTQLLDELHRCPHGSAGRQKVVDDKHFLARFDGVLMDLQEVRTILERVLDAYRLKWQFARFLTGMKPHSSAYASGAPKTKPRASVATTSSIPAGL